MRRLTYFIATSIDGLIADENGSIEAFFPLPDGLAEHLVAEYPETLPTHLHETFGVTVADGRFDAVIQGRGTYQPALTEGITSPYAHLAQYVVSTTLGEVDDPKVNLIDGDPLEAVRELKSRDGGGIWLAGGARLAGSLYPEIDEIIVKVYPLVLGAGKPMFEGKGVDPVRFELTDSTVVGTGGAVIHRYSRI
ncbi:dihydrofolate reductase family protein [Phytomonospora sp. NPDC050363]|uniref:dihydrofolate reductase family protein n=1 Tax=Phytomonospora sp. NPDC050363 TaxID=3155642 RepID=UPI0033E42969